MSLLDKGEIMEVSNMQLSDLLKCHTLKKAKITLAPTDLTVSVTGINILEAPDIEKWGKKGLVILTSYFALKDLDQVGLEAFFKKISEIGISCLILKMFRLLESIPSNFIDLCRHYNIPLLEISENDKYEDIITEVLGFIIASREHRLALYYQVSKISSKMTIDMLGIPEILHEFKDFLQLDLTLENVTRGISISTNPKLSRFELKEELPQEQWEYMTFDYKRFMCKYPALKKTHSNSLIQIDISCIVGSKQNLIIHEEKQESSNINDVIVVENLIRCLQFELLRDHSIKQRIMLGKNTLVNDILRGLFSTENELQEAWNQLGFKAEEVVRVLTLDYHPIKTKEDFTIYSRRSEIRTIIQKRHPRSVYYIAPGYDQFILPQAAGLENQSIAAEIQTVIHERIKFNESSGETKYFGGISDGYKLSEIKEADEQSKAVVSFLMRNYKHSIIEEYQNLGLFKIFVSEKKLDMMSFVQPDLLNLYQENPDYFDTLEVYLKTGKSFTQTAKDLFLHPKTIKYRIDKITENSQLNLDNIHVVTNLLMSIEIINFYKNQTSSAGKSDNSHS